MPTVSMIGTLPPVKGVSAYSREICEAVAAHWTVEFIGFHQIYPEWLYPGGTLDPDQTALVLSNVVQRPILNWYNPLGWIYAGYSAKGDVVHAQWWSYVLAPVYWTLLSLSHMRKKPVVLTLHNIVPHELKPLPRLLNRSVLGLADAYIVHSEANRNTVEKRYKVRSGSIHVIPHGPIRMESQGVSRSEARKWLGLSEESRTVLFFGAIREYKGLDVLIKAFKAMELSGKKLVIAGKAWGETTKYLELIQGDPSIIFHEGYVPQERIAWYMQAADLLVLPYRHFESASGVGGLALAHHVPILVSQVGSLPDLVAQRECCMCKPGDPADVKEKMKLILMDKALQAELRANANTIANLYSWDVIAQKTVSLYEKVLG